MTRHKHFDTIVAWAEGKPIQIWVDDTAEWLDIIDPSWQSHNEYRIKPEPIVKLLNMYYDADQGLCVDTGREFNHNLKVEIDPNDDSIISVEYVRKTDG